jgi:hypothetical protein
MYQGSKSIESKVNLLGSLLLHINKILFDSAFPGPVYSNSSLFVFCDVECCIKFTGLGAWYQWLLPVILATEEAEIKGITV